MNKIQTTFFHFVLCCGVIVEITGTAFGGTKEKLPSGWQTYKGAWAKCEKNLNFEPRKYLTNATRNGTCQQTLYNFHLIILNIASLKLITKAPENRRSHKQGIVFQPINFELRTVSFRRGREHPKIYFLLFWCRPNAKFSLHPCLAEVSEYCTSSLQIFAERSLGILMTSWVRVGGVNAWWPNNSFRVGREMLTGILSLQCKKDDFCERSMFCPSFFTVWFFFGVVVLEQNKADSARICRKTPYKSQSTLPWNLTHSHLKKSMQHVGVENISLTPFVWGVGLWGLDLGKPTREPDSAHPGRQWFQFPLRKTHWTFDRSTSGLDLEAHPVMDKKGEGKPTRPPQKRGGGKRRSNFGYFGRGNLYSPNCPPQHFTKEKSRMKVLCWNVAGFCWHQNLLIAYALLFYVWWFLIDVS